ncbi:MAG: SpoIIE family protein phosphatase [Candidatus Acidiferrales bacterium]
MSEFLPEWLVQVRDVLETLNQGVIITDECPRIVYSNAEFQGMVGRSADELVGQYVKDLFPPEDVPFLLSQIGLGRIQGQARFEFYLPQVTGGHLPVVVAARQLEDPDGRLFAVVTCTDIAEQKNAETELRQANLMLEARERELEEDLLLAARVQQSLSPKSLEWGAASVETYYQAARSIGGDYGLVTPGDDYLTLLVCDVSGHGIGSALVANRIYTETISLIEGGVALTPMLQHLNRFVIHNLGSFFMYFTLAAGRLSRDGRSLEFSGAGHPPTMILRPRQAPRLLESRSTILGCFDDAVSQDSAVQIALEPGDRVALYTDGFSETFNSHGEMLGVDGFAGIVHKSSSLPLPAMKQRILDDVAAWRKGPAVDDMSLILLEVS